MLTSNQQTIYDWLHDNLQLPVFAKAYIGAVDLLNRKSSGYITLVSHVGRDLMNILVKVVVNKENEKGRVEYKELVDEIQDVWENEWGGEGFNVTEDDENGHLIPNEVCKKIKGLVDEHKTGNLRDEDKGTLFFTIFLDYSNKESVPDNLFKEWRLAKKFFEKHTHLRKKGFSMEAPDEVEKHFQNLDNLLYAAAETDIEQLRSIHEILEEANQ